MVIGRLFGSAALALALLAGADASAQRTGTRMDRNQGAAGSISRTDPDSAIRVANAYAQCLARREGRSMRRALDLPFTSPEQAKAIARLREAFDGCLGTSPEFDELHMGQVLNAGGAAEYFVRTDLSRVDLSPLKGMSDEALDKTAFAPRTGLEDLGLCIVRADPGASRALVAASVTTKEEVLAFRALVPYIGPCVTAGSQLKLSLPNVRAVVAYALFRAASKLGVPGA